MTKNLSNPDAVLQAATPKPASAWRTGGASVAWVEGVLLALVCGYFAFGLASVFGLF